MLLALPYLGGGDRMRRREFITLLGGAAVTWQQTVQAQQPGKIPRLCFLTFDPGTLQSNRFRAFFEGLRDLGYVDQQSIVIDYLSAEGRAERYPALAAECLRRNVKVIVVSTTPAAQAAKNVTRTIPIVMIALGDPVGTGLIDSLARPGGNVTGTTFIAPVMTAKRLELLKEAVPQITRVLVLTYLADPIAPSQVKALEDAAPLLGVSLEIRDIRTGDDLPAAFDAGIRRQVGGIISTGESMFFVNRSRVIDLAARHKLPAIYPYRASAVDGGLMSYAQIPAELYRRAS